MRIGINQAVRIGMVAAAVLSAAGGAFGEEAQSLSKLASFGKPEKQPVRAELVTEHASVQPGGKTRVGVQFDLDEGWHIYAQEPGDAGLPTKIQWSGPGSVSFGPLIWPKPQEFVDPGDIRTYGYSGSVVLASEVRLANSVVAGTPVTIRAMTEWLACKDICLPGSAILEMSVPVMKTEPALSTHALLFEQVND